MELIHWWCFFIIFDLGIASWAVSYESFDNLLFGGEVVDLFFWSLLRCVSFVITWMWGFCISSKKYKTGSQEFYFAIFHVLLCISFWAYVVAKCVDRLVEELRWPVSNVHFWIPLSASCIMCSFEVRFALSYIQEILDKRMECAEVVPENEYSLLQEQDAQESTDSHNRSSEKRSVWGSSFDWIYGKIKEVDEDDIEDEKDEKLLERDGDGKDKTQLSASFSKLVKLSLPDLPLISLAFVSLFIAAIGQTVIPKLTGEIISSVSYVTNRDQAAKDKALEELQTSTEKLLVAAAVTAVFTAGRGSLFTAAMSRLNVRIRETLLCSLLGQEIGFFDVTKTGKLASRLNSDTTTLSDQISLNLNVFLRSFVQAVGVLVFMFRLNVSLSLATFVTVPAVALITKVYGAILQELYKETQKRLANANAVSDAALSTMHTVRCFASEHSEMNRYRRKMQLFYELSVRQAVVYCVYCIIYTLLPTLSTALVLYYGGTLVIAGKLKSGELVSFMLYQQSLSEAINTIGSIFSGIAGALGAADKVFELIEREPKQSPKGSEAPEQFVGEVEFKDVSFRYPARPDSIVLKNFNMKIGAGQTVALVGPSGGGKSSVIKLLERLYEPETGVIMLNHKNLDSYDHHYLHRQIGIVGQEPILYARSIAHNIVYGLQGEPDEPTMEEIIEAAKASNAHDFIMAFPDGYNTKCGERGIQLSGGQKQRISIARALVRKPKILLLDEATSALDAESEAVVQSALDEIMTTGHHTCIVVAHRLSTVRNADKIIVIKSGTIQESGTHDELIAKEDSVYKSLVQRQLNME